MDMFNKLKAKLAEEMDSESESGAAGGRVASDEASSSSSSGPRSVAALEHEVAELKEHINKNYFVYVKRLEKRKERIRELEEYSKLVIKDNEALTKKAKELEDCQKQLSECRENLEQLEGFQSQELSKVKHMLLSAETALEAETKERKRAQAEADGLREERGARADREGGERRRMQAELDAARAEHEARMEEARAGHEAQIARLEERLGHQDLSGDERLEAVSKERDALEVELQAARKAAEEAEAAHRADCQALQREAEEQRARAADLEARLATATAERDASRAQVLELEIANHESQASAGSEREKVKLDLAKAATEKETLEMTLQLRDKELKAKKEEFRKELAEAKKASDETTREIQTKSVRISALEAELLHLKSKLAEESSQLLVATTNIDKLESSVQFLEQTMQVKEQNVLSLQKKLDEGTQSAAALRQEHREMAEQHEERERERADLVEARDRLAKECEQLREEGALSARNAARHEEEARQLKAALADRDATFDARVERTETVRALRRRVQEMDDELADKKKLIRLHNQRMTDMKKTIQREMRGPSADPALANGRSPSPPSASASPGPHAAAMSASPSAPAGLADMPMAASQDLVLMSETNFKYLKHVIFKFFTSKDYEAKHLTKAIAALLQFTPDEERLFQEHLDWKLSWFGSKPRHGSGQFSLSIDPK